MDYVFMILYLVQLIYVSGNQCVTPASFCPSTKEEWATRGEQFGKCGSEFMKYTCMLTVNGTVVETCIISYRISPGIVGCPAIVSCIEGSGPSIGLPSSFKTCPTNRSGCPPKEHDGYTVHEMYKYPACLIKGDILLSTILPSTATIESDDENVSSMIAVIITVLVFILAVLSLVIIRYRKLKTSRGEGNRRKKKSHDENAVIVNYQQNGLNKEKETSLHQAAEGGHVDVVSVLLDHGADFNAKDNDGKTSLYRAAGRGHVDVVSVLLDHGADFNDKDERGKTQLHRAANGGHVDVVSELLDQGVDVNAKEDYGMTPLHQAVERRHVDVVSVLLDHGADVNAKDDRGKTPLDQAVERRHVDVVSVLLDHAADVNAKDYDRMTPLHLAAEGGHVDVVSVLLDHGPDVNARDGKKETPLHKAAEEGHVDVVSVLLDHGANVNDVTYDGKTPLHLAAGGGHVNVVSVLLDHGADVNAVTYYDWSPIHFAARGGHVDVVSILLDNGADINAKDKDGDNALQSAVFLPMNANPKLQDFIRQYEKFKCSNADQEKLFKKASKEVIREFEDIPREIIEMGKEKVKQYRRNLRKGSLPSYHIRCMVVGHFGVGKTTLVKALLGRQNDKIESTDGIDVYRGMCFVDRKKGDWKLQDKYTEDLLGLEDKIQIDFWDFAGQAMYYNTHPTYFSYRCLYLLTIDFSLGLDSEVEDRDLDLSRLKKRTVLDFLHFWIGSIMEYSGNVIGGFPKILVIGTHKDKLQRKKQDEICKTVVEDIRKEFSTFIEKSQLFVDEELCGDARDRGSLWEESKLVTAVRHKIIETGERYPTYGEKIPTDCVTMKNVMRKSKQKTKELVLALSKLQEEVGSALKTEDMILYLEFYHSLGHIFFLNEEKLRDYTILDPSLLIDAMKCLITRRSLLSQTGTGQTGTLSDNEVTDLWQASGQIPMVHKIFILNVMERLDLICRPKVYDTEGRDASKEFFYVPSMKVGADSEYLKGNNELKTLNKTKILYTLKQSFVPPAIFHRLVCGCLTVWTVYKDLLFCDEAFLQVLGQNVVLHITMIEKIVQVTILYRTDLSAYVWRSIRKFISEYICRILSTGKENRLPESEMFDIKGENEDIYNKAIDYVEEETSLSISSKDSQYMFDQCTPGTEWLKTELTEKHLLIVSMQLNDEEYDKLFAVLEREPDTCLHCQKAKQYTKYGQNVKAMILIWEWKNAMSYKGEVTAEQLSKIVEEEKVRRAIKHQRKEVNLPNLKGTDILSDRMLDEVGSMAEEKCFNLGVLLGVPLRQIINLRVDTKSTLELTQKVLRFWNAMPNEKADETTKMEELALAMAECNFGRDEIIPRLKLFQ